jgi:hypothetical protein
MNFPDIPTDNESPESKIIPTEDINTIQHKISGEKSAEIILELCDFCHWSLICFNSRGVIENCQIVAGLFPKFL